VIEESENQEWIADAALAIFCIVAPIIVIWGIVDAIKRYRQVRDRERNR
jgi:hypothetical protein